MAGCVLESWQTCRIYMRPCQTNESALSFKGKGVWDVFLTPSMTLSTRKVQLLSFGRGGGAGECLQPWVCILQSSSEISLYEGKPCPFPQHFRMGYWGSSADGKHYLCVGQSKLEPILTPV